MSAYRWTDLERDLAELPGAVVAFSGGVDSAVLLSACRRVLGRERVVAVIADSPSLARSELDSARELARELDVECLELRPGEMEDPRYRANAGDRCFWCKEALFMEALPVGHERGWPVLYGENADDVGDHRPGARSAARNGVRAPLRDAGWSKAMVREYARDQGLTVAEKPAMPCLASRLPVGVKVSTEALAQVEALETRLRARGYRILRARHFSQQRVRLEFSVEELDRAQDDRAAIEADARAAGYVEIELDPEGYRSGSVSLPHGTGGP